MLLNQALSLGHLLRLEAEVRGEVPVAYIVADESFDVAQLDATCRKQLASFKIPRAFLRIDALPRTALGKVQKHLLPPWTGQPG